MSRFRFRKGKDVFSNDIAKGEVLSFSSSASMFREYIALVFSRWMPKSKLNNLIASESSASHCRSNAKTAAATSGKNSAWLSIGYTWDRRVVAFSSERIFYALATNFPFQIATWASTSMHHPPEISTAINHQSQPGYQIHSPASFDRELAVSKRFMLFLLV